MNTEWTKQLSEELEKYSVSYDEGEAVECLRRVFADGNFDRSYLAAFETLTNQQILWIYLFPLSSLTVAGKIPPQMLHTTPDARL